MVQPIEENEEQPDISQAVEILTEMNSSVIHVSGLVQNMLQKVKSGELSTEFGLSFLEVKYHMLLTYLINLTYVVLRKCSGERIEHDPSIERLVEIRTILEKIRPIDNKLRYQIDKLVKTATIGNNNLTDSSSFDPTLFKANPKNFSNDADESDSESESDGDVETDTKIKKSRSNKDSEMNKNKNQIYVPPKINPVPYDGEETREERKRKQLDRARRRALNSSIIQDLKEEYLDTPIEVSSGSRAQQILSKSQKERQEYEENYLTRLPTTKVDKHRQRKLTTLGTLGDEVTSFADLSALGGTMPVSSNSKRKRRISSKKRGGKKRKFH